MCEENGAIFVLPHEVRQTRNNVLPHRAEEGANDLIGYEGEEPGDKIEVEARAIVVFSSTSLHRSSANTTGSSRRAYLAQYSGDIIHHSSGSLWAQAVPFVKAGELIYDQPADLAASHIESR